INTIRGPRLSILFTSPVGRLPLGNRFTLLGVCYDSPHGSTITFSLGIFPDNLQAIKCFRALPGASFDAVHGLPFNLKNTRVMALMASFEIGIEPNVSNGRDH